MNEVPKWVLEHNFFLMIWLLLLEKFFESWMNLSKNSQGPISKPMKSHDATLSVKISCPH